MRAKKPEALAKDEAQLRKELMSLRAQVAMGTTPKSTKQIRAIRKALARINTIRNENKMSADNIADVVETVKETKDKETKEKPLAKKADKKNDKPVEE